MKPETISDLRKKFEYTSDKVDGWRILKGDGPLRGDCDDFAITALWIEADQSMVKFWWMLNTCQAAIWYTKTSRGVGHNMLWVKGKGWIDNNHPYWGERQYRKIFPWPTPAIALKMGVGKVSK